jgi:hypothetical protein
MTPNQPEPERIPVRRHRLPDVHSYDVTADELDQIERDTKGVALDFSFASNALTAMIAFGIVLLTVDIKSERLWAGFFMATMLAGFVVLYCGVRWILGRKAGVRVIQRIRQRQEGPFGNENNELKPVELENLPAQPPPDILADTGKRE